MQKRFLEHNFGVHFANRKGWSSLRNFKDKIKSTHVLMTLPVSLDSSLIPSTFILYKVPFKKRMEFLRIILTNWVWHRD